MSHIFPFGQPLKPVLQQDRAPKKVFILGVYASAVHARWVGSDGKTKIMALAVASEPYIFWRGDGAQDIIDRIDVPKDAGNLVAAPSNLNGPSGHTLDQAFIQPMGLTRDDCWLCDIYPHACMNPKQKAAVLREYLPVADSLHLATPNMPPEPSTEPGEQRRKEILAELEASESETVVLLGDLPVKWWLRFYDDRWNALSDFGADPAEYGQLHECRIGTRSYQVLPLVHPRQAGRLGAHSGKWAKLHEQWTRR
jgi:uracil-DNA glycosylase